MPNEPQIYYNEEKEAEAVSSGVPQGIDTPVQTVDLTDAVGTVTTEHVETTTTTNNVWTNSGTTDYLTTTTNDVVIGATTPTLGAKFTIAGDDNQRTVVIKGASGQTSDYLLVEEFGGTDVFRIRTTGVVVFPNASNVTLSSSNINMTNGNLTVDGSVDIAGNLTNDGNTDIGGNLTVSSGATVNVAGGALYSDSSGNWRLNNTEGLGGTNGDVLTFADNGGDPTVGANVAGIFAKDVAGTVEMFAIGEDDVVTQISPHDPITKEWIFFSKNQTTGKVLKVKMEKMMRFLNDHFGLNFIEEFTENI